MKAALSVALAGLMVVLPLQQVQAQVAQQDAVSVRQASSPEGVAHLLRVPPLTENAALLWSTTADQALPGTEFAPTAMPQDQGVVSTVVIVIVLAALAALAVYGLYIVLEACTTAAENC